jgi:ribose transport system permease protein
MDTAQQPLPDWLARTRVIGLRMFSTMGILPLLLVVAILYFGLTEPRFLGSANILNVSRQATYLVIIAMGQALVLISGGFDLSVGATVALTSVVSASYMSDYYAANPESPGFAILIGVLAGLVVGLVIGLANGIGVAVFKVSPFVMTLGMASIATGFALHYTGGSPVSGMPREFTRNVGTGRFGPGPLPDIPTPVYFAAALIVVMYFVFNWTRLGRYLYAIGGNVRAAYLSGISVTLYLAAVYVICSLLTAIAGILLTARVSSGEPNLGGGFPLESITAAVVGGVSLRGGEGRILNAVLGAIFIVLLTNGMNLIRIESYVQMIAIGIILILAVVVDRFRDRWRA